MKLPTTISLGLLLALVGTSLPVSADSVSVPARGPIPFEAFDRDADGQVSQQEFDLTRGERMAAKGAAGMPMRGVASAPHFSTLDTDGDGVLNAAELAEGQQAMQAKRQQSRQ